jgi:pimeloyl-ACP methyl ester carboxylesterase
VTITSHEAMGWLRAAVGIALIAAPKAPMRLSRRSEPTGASALLMRTIGIRDLVLGLGTVAAARSDDVQDVRRWTTAALASDSLDTATSLASFRSIGKRDAWSAAILALAFVCGDLRARRRVLPGRPLASRPVPEWLELDPDLEVTGMPHADSGLSAARERMIPVNGTSLYVEDHGSGTPVVLLHGWPDSARLWRHQIPFLTANGFRVIAPDLRGLGRSDRPDEVSAYALPNAIADVTAVLDALDIGAAHIVGHDWGAAVTWLTAMLSPDRVQKIVAISVPHLLAPVTIRQREMAWYQLFFQFEGVAEATIQHDDWAWLREFSRGDGDLDQYIEDLSRPGALTASLNWYRANLAPGMPGPPLALPPVRAPVLGIWSTGDHYLDGERWKKSGSLVQGPWRYEEIAGASHWIPLDAPDHLNGLLLDWLG